MAVTKASVEMALMRTLDSREEEYVDAYIEAATGLLYARIPDLAVRVIESERTASLVSYVVGQMVARVFRNADGIYKTESDGDYSYTIDTSIATGRLYASKDELRMLTAGTYGWSVSRPGEADAKRHHAYERVVLPVDYVESLASDDSKVDYA